MKKMAAEYKKIVTSWMDEIFKNENFKILKYEFPEIQVTGGYVSKMINIKVTVEKKNQTEILDLLIKLSNNSSDVIFTEAYLTEINLYSKIVPYFNKFAEEHGVEKFKNVPYCYGVHVADEHFVAVLENLKPKGFRVRDLAPLDMNHVKLVLKALAEFHAFGFALRDQKPDVFNDLIKPNIELEESKLVDLSALSFEEQMDFTINLYEGKNKPNVLDKLKLLRKNFRDIYKKFLRNEDEEYVAICHMDVWNNNCLFKYNEECMPTEVRLVDWQTTVVGSPLIDVSQIFFFCCLREELEHIDDLLKRYHQTISEKIRQLGSNPEKCFPWEACLKAFKRYAALGIAGMPFLMRMYFSNESKEESNNPGETSVNGNFSAVIGDEISDPEKLFESINAILELCIERDLI